MFPSSSARLSVRDLIERYDAHAPRYTSYPTAARYLTGKGWQAVGLDHFALPHDGLAAADRAGRLHRNFQGYTTDAAEVLIGLGASSISRTPRGFVQNHTQERDWRQAVGAGALPVARGVVLTEQVAFVGEIIKRLMCDFVVDVAPIARRRGRDLSEVAGRLVPAGPVRPGRPGLAGWNGGGGDDLGSALSTGGVRGLRSRRCGHPPAACTGGRTGQIVHARQGLRWIKVVG